MLTKEGLEFLLRLTDFFHGHWEDPEWGRRVENQALLLAGINTLTEGIADAKTRKEIQSVVATGMVASAQRVVKAPATSAGKTTLSARA